MSAMNGPSTKASQHDLPARGQEAGWLLITVVLVLAGGLAGLSMLTSRSGEPLVLTVLALLAMIGAFFLFGLAAGYIRMGDRPDDRGFLLDVIDQSGVGIVVTRPDGTPVQANAAYRAMTHGGAQSLEDVLSGEPVAAEALFRLTRAAAEGSSHSEVVRLRGISGSRQAQWLRLSVDPLRTDGTYSSGDSLTIWRVLDVTSERAQEAEVRAGLEAALQLYDALPFGVVTLGPSGRIITANATVLQQLGLSSPPGRLPQLIVDDVFASESVGAVKALLRQPLRQTTSIDIAMLDRQGKSLPVNAVAMARQEAAHDQTLVILDKTARLTSAIDASEAGRAARSFEAAPFGIAIVDPAGRILSSNAAFARLFAGRQEPHSMASLVSLFQAPAEAEARNQLLQALAQLMAGEQTGGPIDVTFGAERQFARRIYMSPITGQRSSGEAAVLFVLDTSEQKSLELMFAQSQKMEAIGKFVGGIAHDFNNVLTVILGLSDFLLRNRRPTDPGYTDMMQIKSNANRAANMVRQLLAFSRKQTLTPEMLDLNDVVQDFGYSLNRLLGEKITLKVSAGRDLWPIKADRTQLEQVIMNLAANARDAMPGGGRLTVRTRNIGERDSQKLKGSGLGPGEYVLVEVEDTGTGMSAEVMQKIFEPFFTTKEIGKGTGLGLATVYGIVRQTGGQIIPESEIGKGTTFRVYLPRYIPSSDEEPSKVAKKERARDLTGSGRVLLVEDEDGVRSFASRALKQQGYTVLEASSGVEALDVMKGQTVDIVVSDVLMPEMDGPTLMNELRKETPDLKFIFVSGYADDALEKSLDAKAQFAFLPKPFTLPQLAAKVKEELGK
ncbi:MAG TPA: response regulator [Hyphomicrobiaceae bacterium]|nr:response regulator [Hyphomicrobiaceae bacterium]